MNKGVFYFLEYKNLFEADESESEIEELQSKEDKVTPDQKDNVEKTQVFAVGDIIEYRTRKYDDDKKKEDQQEDAIAQGEIKKVIRGGKKYRIYNKNIDREFTKYGKDILSKSSGDSTDSVNMGDEELLEKIYSDKVFKFGTI